LNGNKFHRKLALFMPVNKNNQKFKLNNAHEAAGYVSRGKMAFSSQAETNRCRLDLKQCMEINRKK